MDSENTNRENTGRESTDGGNITREGAATGSTATHYLGFTLGRKHFALPLDVVGRVTYAAAVTPLPDGPDILAGIINYKGDIVPVIDLAVPFGLPKGEVHPDRFFIILDYHGRTLGLLADSVADVRPLKEEYLVHSGEIVKKIMDGADDIEPAAAVIKTEGGMLLVPNLDRLFSPEQQRNLHIGGRTT